MEVVSSCITCLGGVLLDPLKRQVQYIKDFKENVQCLQREWKELHSQEENVIQLNDRGRLALIEIRNQNEVDRWLENVKGLEDSMKGIEREFGENKRCLNGCLPNYYSRLKLSKEVERLTGEVKNLIEKKPSVNIVDADQVPPARLGIPAEHFQGAAATKAFESICKNLMNEKIAKIGVYGMGGVGKTTIIKNIKNSLQKDNIFNDIVFVTVSRFPVKTIQEAIAKQIRLPVDKDYNEETMSIMLHEALHRRKRFLLILDDLWEKLPLKDIGIPEPHADCKVVLTTRSYSVCKAMGTQEEIKVEVLSPDDAWSLFQENACVDDPQVKEVAKRVVEKCGGLPLAIITVGQGLSGVNDVGVWRNALNQLKDSTSDILEMEKGVIQTLKFSFDRLKNEKLQECFLYCSLFPEDYKIKADELIDHWIWDGLIDQMDNKQDEVDNGRSLLNELKRACMLEFDDGFDTVKMHDLMRDMAIGITSHSQRFMVKAGLGLEKAPTENEWPEDVERISLMNNRIQILSGQPKCPRLRTLLLDGNYSLSEIIPHSFFDNMCNLHVLLLNFCGLEKMPSLANLKELRVLHLSSNLVVEMPESLSSLENLLELNLSSCKNLKMLPSFAKLKKLRNLDLSCCSSIEELSGSFSELKSLLELQLSGCENLKMLPSFEKLKKLRNLDLSWCTSIKELPGSFSELENLDRLNLFGCENLKMLPSFEKLKELRNLDLGWCTSIEELPGSFSKLENLLELQLSGCKNIKMLPSFAKLKKLRNLGLMHFTCIEELPGSFSELENLDELDLYGCENLKMLPSFAKLKKLRNLILGDCTSIEELPGSFSELENLDELDLSGCRNLKMLPSFAKLKKLRTLNLTLCTSIEELPGSFSELENLLELRLFRCENLKMLPSFEKLKKLRNLYLHGCTSIEELSGSFSELENLDELDLHGCENLKMLPSFEKLKKLKNLDLSWCTSIEELPGSFSELENLDRLDLFGCKNLKMLPSFEKLKELRNLRLCSCTSIEELPDRLNLCECEKLKMFLSFGKPEKLRNLDHLV